MSASSQLRSPLPEGARRTGAVIVWVLLALVMVVVSAAVWIAVRGGLALGHLLDAQQGAKGVSATLDDPAEAGRILDSISRETSAARDLTGDPVWALAEGVPWIGDQLHAVRVAIVAVDDVAGSALTPLVESASGLSLAALAPAGGTFDLETLTALREPAAQAAAGAANATAAVDDLDTLLLLSPLAEQVTQLQALLHNVSGATDALSRASLLMPAMLGSDGPRNTLVVFQNNAEWRSLGGIVGATAMIHSDGGAVSLAAQASSGDFARSEESVLPLGDELLAIFDQKPGRYIQNVTQVPSFPLAGQLAQQMWARESGVVVDSVVSVDPVALSYLLEATGPVPLPTGDVLSSENAISLLLNEVYHRYERPADQDAFFQAATAAVFDRLRSGGTDTAALVSALAKAGSERRILVWNADPALQAVLDGTALQGTLPVTDAERTSFGVYVNDGTGSKMNYYTKLGVGVGWCTDTDGNQNATLTVTLRSDAPADAASLPAYITGGGGFGVTPGITRTVAYLYLPSGSSLRSSTTEGTTVASGFNSATHDGRPVLTWTTELAPGEEITARITARTPFTDDLLVEATPVIPGNEMALDVSCISGG